MGVMPESGPDPYVQFLENWIPGIGECTELHDKLHDHFELDFSVNSEARLLGFQLGLSLIHISEPTRPLYISYAVFCLKKKK